jgi:hypothetical protein
MAARAADSWSTETRRSLKETLMNDQLSTNDEAAVPELGEEELDLVAGGQGIAIDPNGRT